MGSVLSDAQIWGEKQSIPKSNRLPPEEQLSSRMSGRGAKIRRSTSYKPRTKSWAFAPNATECRFMSHLT